MDRRDSEGQRVAPGEPALLEPNLLPFLLRAFRWLGRRITLGSLIALFTLIAALIYGVAYVYAQRFYAEFGLSPAAVGYAQEATVISAVSYLFLPALAVLAILPFVGAAILAAGWVMAVLLFFWVFRPLWLLSERVKERSQPRSQGVDAEGVCLRDEDGKGARRERLRETVALVSLLVGPVVVMSLVATSRNALQDSARRHAEVIQSDYEEGRLGWQAFYFNVNTYFVQAAWAPPGLDDSRTAATLLGQTSAGYSVFYDHCAHEVVRVPTESAQFNSFGHASGLSSIRDYCAAEAANG